MGQASSDQTPTLSAMDLISKFVQSLRECPSIQGIIPRFLSPSQLTYFFLILIGSIFGHSFGQHAIYGDVCWTITLHNQHQLTNPLNLGILWRLISTGIILTPVCLPITPPKQAVCYSI